MTPASAQPAGAPPPEAPTAADAPLWPSSRTAWYSVCVIAFISVLSNIDRGIMAVLVQPIKRDLGISDTQMSLLIGAAFSVSYMLVGLPMSRVADVKSRRLILTIGLSVWSFATAVGALAYNFATLFVARGIVGAAESVKGPSSLSMISDIVPRRKLPRAMAIQAWGIAAGAAASLIIGGSILGLVKGVTPLRVPIVGELHDWQIVFLSCGIPGLLYAAFFFLTVKEPTRKGRKTKGAKPLREVAGFIAGHRAIYIPLFISQALAMIEQYGMSAWRVAFFERTYGWGPSVVGPILGTASLLTIPVGLFIGTMIAEHFDRRKLPDAMVRLCLLSHLVTVPLGIAAPLMPSPWLALGGWMLLSIGSSIGSPAVSSALQIITPNEMRGQVSALYLLVVSAVAGALGPLSVAVLTDYVFVDETMLRYAMATATTLMGPLGIFLAWKALRPYGAAVTAIIAEEGENTLGQ